MNVLSAVQGLGTPFFDWLGEEQGLRIEAVSVPGLGAWDSEGSGGQ